MRKHLLPLLLLLIALLGGCVSFDQETLITLNPDGSGTLRSSFELLEEEPLVCEPPSCIWSEKIQEDMEDFGPALHYLRHEPVGTHGYRAWFSFARIDDVRIPSPLFDTSAKDSYITFAYRQSWWFLPNRLKITMPRPALRPRTTENGKPAEERKLRQHMRVVVQMPAQEIHTRASRVKGAEVTLIDADLAALQRETAGFTEASQFRAYQQANSEKPERFIEPHRRVIVKFK